MDYTKKFAESILNLTKAYFRKEENPQEWKRKYSLTQNILSAFEMHTVLQVLDEEGSVWMNQLETIDRDSYLNEGTFTKIVNDIKTGFVEHLSECSTSGESEEEMCYVVCSTKIAAIANYAEHLGAENAQSISIVAIRSIVETFETSQLCLINPSDDLISYRGD